MVDILVSDNGNIVISQKKAENLGPLLGIESKTITEALNSEATVIKPIRNRKSFSMNVTSPRNVKKLSPLKIAPHPKETIQNNTPQKHSAEIQMIKTTEFLQKSLPITHANLTEKTSIKIIHTDYQHLQNHQINITLRLMNQFIAATFKNKEPTLDIKLINQLSKIFHLQQCK